MARPSLLVVLAGAALVAAGCSGDRGARPAPPEPRGSSPRPLALAPVEDPAPRTPATGLSIPEARRYMVELINRDRRSMGLSPVTLDEGAPTRAGQGHAEDMAENGYLGHWGLDGSVPEQRLTEAGGEDMVLENASCFTDERRRPLDPAPRLDPAQIEKAESMFFNEVAPNDGHRRNILKRWHTRVGIGVAQPRGTATEIPVPCLAQEFTDTYGAYGAVPRVARVGDRLHIAGAMRGVQPLGVGLARVDLPRPLSAADANARRSYQVPQPYQVFWPPGYETPIPLAINGPNFAIDLALDDHGKPGLYEVSIWAKLPGSSEPQVVGLRTIEVR